MTIAGNAQETLQAGRGTVEEIADWFAANADRLPIALIVAAAIVGTMLIGRWIGAAM